MFEPLCWTVFALYLAIGAVLGWFAVKKLKIIAIAFLIILLISFFGCLALAPVGIAAAITTKVYAWSATLVTTIPLTTGLLAGLAAGVIMGLIE